MKKTLMGLTMDPNNPYDRGRPYRYSRRIESFGHFLWNVSRDLEIAADALVRNEKKGAERASTLRRWKRKLIEIGREDGAF